MTGLGGQVIDLKPTLDRIASGTKLAYKNDGSIFKNFPLRGKSAPELPIKPTGYYREYVHPTPTISGIGPQRLVTGKGGEIYYTPDHYTTFIRIR
ncbi:ribonuclease domain-containing protein [Varunaivibrio sulfuroxidans]|uniref:ribonuclease domain-containing protein n=1 Tax=Varunaivibrio sulfuroxidans TaxID=1773489 RepID=UPI001046C861|nr:ribonuclease domain-containing protein [Varunaivibrio sulfuroxidans]WES32022.1 ribonuclease domain-containing protein [Varunaivibrio sulfuroxidans]